MLGNPQIKVEGLYGESSEFVMITSGPGPYGAQALEGPSNQGIALINVYSRVALGVLKRYSKLRVP